MNKETNSNTNNNTTITKPLNPLMNRWSETTSAKQSPSIHQDWIRYIETKGTYRNPASLTNHAVRPNPPTFQVSLVPPTV